MTPESLVPFSYLLRVSVQNIESLRMSMCTYVVAKKCKIVSKISVSVVELLSNPGVSIRVTVLPPRVNLSESRTLSVRDSKPVESGKLEPLARLINLRQSGELLVVTTQTYFAYRRFPTSNCADDSVSTIRMRFKRESELLGTHAIRAGGGGVD